MKIWSTIRFAVAFAFVIFSAVSGFAQSSPGLVYGQVPTAAQWNGYFAVKQDVLGYTPLNKAGDTMLGPLATLAPTASAAGFSIPQGTAPSSPNNGDIWLTPAGLYYRAGNITFGPIGAGTITGPGTTTVGNIAKWGNASGTSLVDGGPLGTAATQNTGTSGHALPFLDGANTWSAAQNLGTPSAINLTNAVGLPLISGVTGTLPATNGGTGVTSSTGTGSVVLSNGAAIGLANGTGLPLTTGITGTLGVANGGTGGTTQAAARTGIGAAASGANSDITSLSGLTTALSVAQGGTGTTTSTGTGSVVRSASPALTGTPTAPTATQGNNSTQLATTAYVDTGLATKPTMVATTNGSWTPVLSFGGASTGITYSSQTGYYSRVGSLVFVGARIALSSKGTATGSALISGLPFTNVSQAATLGVGGVTGTTGLTSPFGVVAASGATIGINQNTGAGSVQATDANFTNTTIMNVSGVYDIGTLN